MLFFVSPKPRLLIQVYSPLRAPCPKNRNIQNQCVAILHYISCIFITDTKDVWTEHYRTYSTGHPQRCSGGQWNEYQERSADHPWRRLTNAGFYLCYCLAPNQLNIFGTSVRNGSYHQPFYGVLDSFLGWMDSRWRRIQQCYYRSGREAEKPSSVYQWYLCTSARPYYLHSSGLFLADLQWHRSLEHICLLCLDGSGGWGC
jgi:hypothetical protein